VNAAPITAPMRFKVDGWEVGYGSAMDVDDLTMSQAVVELDVEVPEGLWKPVGATAAVAVPDAVLFVDGVRRIDARVWINEGDDTTATMGICASYAAGVVSCCAGRAEVVRPECKRGVFSAVSFAEDIETSAGVYEFCKVEERPPRPLPVVLSSALQEELARIEVETASTAREALAGGGIYDDLLIIDGPLRGREHLQRAVGYIKSHNRFYLPPELNAMVASMTAGQRTPVFRMGTTWNRHAWYLRLPCAAGAPWAGVVRVEANARLSADEVVALANLTQTVLPRYASAEYKDARAPQNLYPIAGLEKNLRHRLGDQQFVYRALRKAAHST